MAESDRHVVVAEKDLLALPSSSCQCELCGLSVKTGANLRAHHVKTHKIVKTDADRAFYYKRKREIKYIYHCPVSSCKHNVGQKGGGFSTKSRLKQHYQIVHMKRFFKCESCGIMFATPSSLAYHMRFCGSVFSCPVCARPYSVKKHLYQHFRRTGHRPSNELNSQKKDIISQMDEKSTPVNSSHLPPSNNLSPNSLPRAPVVPLQPLVLPMVILPVAFWDPNATKQPFPANFGADTLDLLSLIPGLFPGGLPLGTFLPGTNNPLPSPNFVQSMANPLPVPRSHRDSSTQTEMSLVGSAAVAPISSVSVETCTNEDDINSFLGSLFCDAGVETNPPEADEVVEATSEELILTAETHPDSPMHSSSSQMRPPEPSFPLFSPVDEGIQTGLRYTFEHVSMQTDKVTKSSVGAATHDVPFHWNDRPLETPPPFDCGVKDIGNIPDEDSESGKCHLLHLDPLFRNSPTEPLPPDPHSASSLPNFANLDGSDIPNSTSIGLQSCPWSPSRAYSSIASQTLTDDWESWLNSVHTQTSSPSPSKLNSFADICVGVDDGFLDDL